MEEESTLQAVTMSTDSDCRRSSSEVTVETVSSSTGQTLTLEESHENISSPTVLASKNENLKKYSDLSPEMSLPLDKSPSCRPIPFETSDRPTVMSDIASGFDSADSTNDADFLTTQKAVLSAIDLMDEGLKGEEESSVDNTNRKSVGNNILISKNECETATDASCTGKSEQNLDLDKINTKLSTIKDISDSYSTLIQAKNIGEYSGKGDSVTKEIFSGNDLEKKDTEVGENEVPKGSNPIDDIKIDNFIKITTNESDLIKSSSHNKKPIYESGENPETHDDAKNESTTKKQLNIDSKSIIIVNENLNDSDNVSDHQSSEKTVETEVNIDRGYKNDELKNIEKLSVGKITSDRFDSETSDESIKNLEVEHVTSRESLEISETSDRLTPEDSVKAVVLGKKVCDVDLKLEQSTFVSDVMTENKNRVRDSDEIVMLDEIPSSIGNKVHKREIEPTLPVSVEISDFEVSVFKYEINKKDKAKKIEEKPESEGWKLDDMVLGSDDSSDDSEHERESPDKSNISKDVLTIIQDLSDTTEANSPHKTEAAITTSSEDTKELGVTNETQSPKNKNSGIEVMDEEESHSIQEECNSKNQEETTKVELEESIISSEKKEVSSENSSECLPNENNEINTQNENLGLKESKDMEKESRNDFNDNNGSKTDDSDVDTCKDSEIETVSDLKNDQNQDNCKSTVSNLQELLRAALVKNEEFRENLSRESTKDAEVICLVDDDEEEVNEKKKPAAAVYCVNPNCMSGEDLAKPAMFVLSYFGLKRTKGQQVCAECFDMVVEHQELLSSLLREGKPLLSANFPSHKDVILLDSDEESLSDNESNLSDETMSVIRDNLDDVISESLAKCNLDFQLRESCTILKNRLAKLEEEARDINKRFDDVQNSLDEFRRQIYQDFQQETKEKEELHFMECEIPPMPIIKSKLQNQLYNRELMNRLRRSQQEKEEKEMKDQQFGFPTRTIATKKVSQMSQPQMAGDNATQDVTFVRTETRCDPPPNLPPQGTLIRSKLRVGDLAYTMKVSYFSIWVHCRIIEVIPRNPSENDPSTETYRVKIENVKKNAVRTVTGKYLAYPTPARVQLKVGMRVIAIFKEEDESGVTKDNYYVGVIAEPPKSTNKYRYLVFFDDGYTQYCPHENVLVVCVTSKNVWEDIHPEPRDFIKNYLQQYPERPMVKLSRGQIVKVEWNGRWWIVRVLEVDGSLVKVHFDADGRTEWIYRGSTRLGPMYQELAAAKERQTGSLLRSRGFGGGTHHKSDMPYVEYTRGDGDGDGENKPEEKEKAEEPEEQAPAPRSVARKSTSKKPPEPVISNATYTKPLVNQVPDGQLRERRLRPRCCPLEFRPHQCSNACVAWTGYTPAVGKKYDPLVKPLIYGFHRYLSANKGKTIVMYVAPCGRKIRTHQEMLCYLRCTKSQLTIDLFDFDFWVNPLNEFEESSTFGKIEDLSYGKENVRISCVNELDHSMPQYVQYMTARKPANDVHLNLDSEFLVGCDCTDDCEDRFKCSCWQLTMQGKAYSPDGDLDPLFGYQYRRLPERIATGIYECNANCKCSMTCQNRVAQQPLSCRLQLFKTLKKGWGIRCLHDIPRGAFICIYAGFLLTEQEANEGGKTYGDEYLAELDYIESVENLKEGYESEAKEPSDLDDDEEDDDTSQKDTMDFEYEHSADSDVEAEPDFTRKSGDIRSKQLVTLPPPPLPPTLPSLPWALRLRRRTADEAEKESRKVKPEDDTISISDDEVETVRKPKTFDANITVNETGDAEFRYPSVRELYGPDENVYIMDAKTHGNIGRYLNHSCSPNVFVQNVFVDTHDLRFPWVAFFANQYIQAGTELTWDYNYDVGSVPGKVMLCYCGSNNCRGRLL